MKNLNVKGTRCHPHTINLINYINTLTYNELINIRPSEIHYKFNESSISTISIYLNKCRKIRGVERSYYNKKNKKKSPTMEVVEIIQKSLSENDKKELNSAKACFLVACRPSVELLKQVINKHLYIDFENTKKIIQKIEKRLWQKNLYRKPTIVVGLALHLGNDITQGYSIFIIKEFGICSEVSIRNLGKVVKMQKNYIEGRKNNLIILDLIDYINNLTDNELINIKYLEICNNFIGISKSTINSYLNKHRKIRGVSSHYKNGRKSYIKNILKKQKLKCFKCGLKFHKGNEVELINNIHKIYCKKCVFGIPDKHRSQILLK